MHFPLFLVPIALFAATADCLPLDSSDQELFLPDLTGPDSSGDLTAGSNILADANSYPLTSNNAEFLNSDLFAPSSSEGLIASSNIGGSDPDPLHQIPDDEANLFNSDLTAANTFSDSTVGSDILGNSQNWLEPSLTLAASANEGSTNEISVCCGHGESLYYYCTQYVKGSQICNQASILCPANSALTDPFDESKCRPDPDGRTNVNEAVDMFTALGDAVFHWLTMPIGITVIGCKILSVLALQGWRCGDPNQP